MLAGSYLHIFSALLWSTTVLVSAEVFSPDCKNESCTIPQLFLDPDPVGNWTSGSFNDKEEFTYSDKGAKISFNCKAPYPIRWSLQDKMRQPTRTEVVLHYYEYIRDIVAGTSVYDMNGKVDFTEDGKRQYIITLLYGKLLFMMGTKGVARVTCEKVEDSNVSVSHTLFVRGNYSEVIIVKVNTSSECQCNNLTNSRVIPCIATNPFSSLTLYKSNDDGTEEIVRNLSYDPAMGFKSDYFFNGKYICRGGSNYKVVYAVAQVLDPEFRFEPESSQVSAFSDGYIRVKCSSRNGGSVELNVDDVKEVIVLYTKREVNTEEATLLLKDPERVISSSAGNFEVSGNISCHLLQDGKAIKTIQEWRFAFYAPPEITVERVLVSGVPSVHCRSASRISRLCYVACFDTFECQLKFSTQSYESKISDEKCAELEKEENATQINGQNILTLTTDFQSLIGVLQCTLVGGLSKAVEVFYTNNGSLLYTSWKDVPRSDLLYLSSENKTSLVFYANSSTWFLSSSLGYIFQKQVIFELEYKNGPTQVLSETFQNSSHIKYNISQMFVLMWVLKISLPIDATAVHAKAYFLNSTEFLLATARFETRYTRRPLMENDEKEENVTLFLNEKGRRLFCPGSGVPKVDYSWTIGKGGDDLRNISEVFLEVKTGISPNGHGYLEFPVASKKYSDEYRCIAKNVFGEVEKIFVVNVKEKTSIENVITGAIIGATFALVGLAVTVTACILRFKKRKQSFRDLTPNEVQDFLDGRPGMLEDLSTTSDRMIDAIPYKVEYEIPSDNLDFEENILGSGEFSYIVKGNIVSSGKEVAVKITKVTVDLQMFKALLSEIKIMIHVGRHANIVNLVGANTENIQNRYVCIATEFCEGGSLDKFLQNKKATLPDLIGDQQNESSSMELTELGMEWKRLTESTLDLISFAGQIATGMEYLGSKSVVHADLAARNVLLTAQKTVKICDFGLSRLVAKSSNKSSKSPVSWQWAAPEVLENNSFSVKSDVWSYGMTLYEMFSLGEIPFWNEQWSSNFLSRLKTGMRLGRPIYSTPEIYGRIGFCWDVEPEDRPTFGELNAFFKELLSQHTSNNLELYQAIL